MNAHGGGRSPLTDLLACARFPRASTYHPSWIRGGVSGGAHPLWLTEWLCEALPLRSGMRVLDLGCGRALSSIFLHREYGVQVWAIDAWFSASENLRRVQDAGVFEGVFPLHADARSLPFAANFFDAIVSIDSFPYYGTDDFFLGTLARYLKPGGLLGIAGAGLAREIDGNVPGHLHGWWTPDLHCLHSPPWWRSHWQRTGLVDVTLADTMADGTQRWVDWQRVVAPDNLAEIDAVGADAGDYLAYVRVVAARSSVTADEPVTSVNTTYAPQPLLRTETTDDPVS